MGTGAGAAVTAGAVAATGAGVGAAVGDGDATETVGEVASGGMVSTTIVAAMGEVVSTTVGVTINGAAVKDAAVGWGGTTVVCPAGWAAAARTVVMPNTADAVRPVTTMRAPAATWGCLERVGVSLVSIVAVSTGG